MDSRACSVFLMFSYSPIKVKCIKLFKFCSSDMYFISLEKASERLVCLLNSFENTFICSRTAFYVCSNKRFNFITHQSKKKQPLFI